MPVTRTGRLKSLLRRKGPQLQGLRLGERCEEKEVLGWPKGLRLSRVEDNADGRSLFGDDVKGYLDLVDLADKNPIDRVPPMQNKIALRLDALEGGMDGKGQNEETVRVSILRSLLAAQTIVSEAQVGLVFCV